MKKKWLGALSAVVLVFAPVVSSGFVYGATVATPPKQTEEIKSTLLPVEGIHSTLTLGESGKLLVGEKKETLAKVDTTKLKETTQTSDSISEGKKSNKAPNLYKFTSLNPKIISVDSEGNWKTLKSGKANILIEETNAEVATIESSTSLRAEKKATSNSEIRIHEFIKDEKNNASKRSIEVEVFAAKIDIKEVDISPNLTLNGISKEVIVGDKGELKGEIGTVAGVSSLGGQYTYSVQDSSLLSLDIEKNWKALKSGGTTITLKFEYSENSMKRFKEKYPDAKLVVKTDSLTQGVTIKDKEGISSSSSSTSSTSSISSTSSVSSTSTSSSSTNTSSTSSSSEKPPEKIDLVSELLGATSTLKQDSKGTFGILMHTKDGLVNDLDVTADYSSNNSSVLQVDKNGNYIALKPGKAILSINFTLTDKSVERLKAAYNISNLASTSGVATYDVTVVANTTKSSSSAKVSGSGSTSPTSSGIKKPLPQTGEQIRTGFFTVVGIGLLGAVVLLLVKKKRDKYSK